MHQMQKKPIYHKDKVITHYSDVNSVVLKNYIDISQQRLSKVKAGFHLNSVLNSQSQNTSNRPMSRAVTANFNTRQVNTQESFNPRNNQRTGTQGSDMPMSEFMDNYINQKNVDEELLMTKEDNIQDFFKEKYTLMGKYLGEDILKKGLLVSSPQPEQRNFTSIEKFRKNNKNMDSETREKHLMNLLKEDTGEGGPTAKVVQINREIMGQILKEEHQQEMEELLRLQTEQNLQVFNDLQDVDEKAEIRKTLEALGGSEQELPGKVFLKSNFLRTSVGTETRTHGDLPDNEQPLIQQNAPKKLKGAILDRPRTENLMIRSHRGRENMLPDVEKIVTTLDKHKFGTRAKGTALDNKDTSINILFNTTLGNRMNTPMTMVNERISSDTIRAKTAVSAPRLQMPKLKIETNTADTFNLKPILETHKSQKNASIPTSNGKPLSEIIDEEIEFLQRQRNPDLYKSQTASEKFRVTKKQNNEYKFVPFDPQSVKNSTTISNMMTSPSTQKSDVNRIAKRLNNSKGLTINLGDTNKSPISDFGMSVGGRKLVMSVKNGSETQKTQKNVDYNAIDINSNRNRSQGQLVVRTQTRNFYTRYLNARKPQNMSGVVISGRSEKIEPFVTRLISSDHHHVSLEPYQGVISFSGHKGVNKQAGLFGVEFGRDSKGRGTAGTRGDGSPAGMLVKNSMKEKFWRQKQ